jgi:hypothetical protein
MAPVAMSMECKLKKKCPNPTADLLNCWFEQCTGWIHEGCCNLLLDKYEVPSDERPSVVDVQAGTEEPVVFCTKGCHAKWRSFTKKKEKESAAAAKAPTKKKRKVPWEEDGSMDVLMEWLTTEGNYASYCGGAGCKGTSKSQFQKQISLLINKRNPDSDGRTEKDVENKITALERQFRVASNWANNTGQGVTNPGDFKAAIMQRCPYYKQLEDIMGD